MARQCEDPSVLESALTIRLQDFRTGLDDGNKSEGKSSRKELRYTAYTGSARCTFCILKICRVFERKIY